MASTTPPVSNSPAASSDPLVTHTEQEALFALSEELLQAIHFFRYNPAVVMRTLRQIAYRADLTTAEHRLLMAILRKLLRQVEKS